MDFLSFIIFLHKVVHFLYNIRVNYGFFVRSKMVTPITFLNFPISKRKTYVSRYLMQDIQG